MLAIVPPPRLSLGRRIRLSSMVRWMGGGMAPGSTILLWDSFAGSVKATHIEALEWSASVNKLS
jgi:hypothetical protein